jgi:hypothetical protein
MILPTSASIAAPLGIVCPTAAKERQKRAQGTAKRRSRRLLSVSMLRPLSEPEIDPLSWHRKIKEQNSGRNF